MKRTVIVLAAALVMTACSVRSSGDRPWRRAPDTPPPAPEAPAPQSYPDRTDTAGVSSVSDLKLRDHNRGKDLELRVTYPDGAGPYPIILFSHGAWSSKDEYVALTEYWAANGYVVFQPNHSDSKDYGGKPGPDSFKDWPERPADLSFILDSLPAIEARIPTLTGIMDTGRIGAGGHSFGGLTVQLMGGAPVPRFSMKARNKDLADPRVSALLLMSPPGSGQVLNEKSWQSLTLPRMTITGSNDISKRRGQGYEWRTEPYKYSPDGDNYLVVIDGADHGLGGTATLENTYGWVNNRDQVEVVKSASLAFWDAYLKRTPSAMQKVASGGDFVSGSVRGKTTMKGSPTRLTASGSR